LRIGPAERQEIGQPSQQSGIDGRAIKAQNPDEPAHDGTHEICLGVST
jgi:hypothetical protein